MIQFYPLGHYRGNISKEKLKVHMVYVIPHTLNSYHVPKPWIFKMLWTFWILKSLTLEENHTGIQAQIRCLLIKTVILILGNSMSYNCYIHLLGFPFKAGQLKSDCSTTPPWKEHTWWVSALMLPKEHRKHEACTWDSSSTPRDAIFNLQLWKHTNTHTL